ncbi:MAG: DEAD/DEAH box helicase [Armatimonadota bacterium]
MSLNPIAFGEHVVEQFQRYLLTYFPIADQRLEAQVRAHLTRGPGGRRELVRGPYIQLNRPFEPGPYLRDLLADPELELHPALPGLFRFEQLYKHQELAMRHILAGKHTIMATATGSGKTEGFLLPVLSHCLHLRDAGAPEGVVAVLVYPMNALVNDQLDRLRGMLAGSGISFARYTGDTPHQHPDTIEHLTQSRPYTDEELRAHREDHRELPRPWEEAISREEIRARKPRLLLTNYRMLELLLLRDQDLRELLDGAPLRFLVFDEVHTYVGTLGAEVACLIRRLRHVAGKCPDEVVCIGTSATVRPEEGVDAEALTRNFAHRLFGVPCEHVALVSEQYREFAQPPADRYTPPRPLDPAAMLDRVLAAARQVHLQDDIADVPASLVAVAEELCGRTAAGGENGNARLLGLLAPNEIVINLSRTLTRPLTLEDLHARLRQVGDRGAATEDDLTCEAMAYLTLGAICRQDDEPLLRPKLHYFVQGYPGLWVSFEPESADATAQGPILPRVHFQQQARAGEDAQVVRLPLLICRACGQHYLRVLAQDAWAADAGNSVRPVRAADPWEEPGADERECYLTDRLHTREEDSGEEAVWQMCRWCGALHRGAPKRCQNERCQRAGAMVPMQVFEDPKKLEAEGDGRGRVVTCAACSSRDTITDTRSAEVADVHTLAESMLSAMTEPTLRKLLIFSDNRQEAAFQAGWMARRAQRHEMRHLLHVLLHEDPTPRTPDELTRALLDRLEATRVLKVGVTDQERREADTRVRWFVDQEFASRRERFGNLETLGLARVEYEGLDADADREFFGRWAEAFGIQPGGVVAIVRTLLDFYRRRGALSDELLQRAWTVRDEEVYRGLISVGDWWRPTVLTLATDAQGVDAKKLLTAHGHSAAQHIVAKGVRDGTEHVDDFLEALWDWLRAPGREYLVPVEITQKRQGKPQVVTIGADVCQVNARRTKISAGNQRHVCAVCRGTQGAVMPTGACPEWRCEGTLQAAEVDSDHYAVVRYTREDFVPLRPVEHSGQVDQDQREVIEQQFKQVDGEYNCIVCTPTLELGVDIGQLEMTLMRNVPPTPANYAQRAGRAGRRHRIAVVVDYCGTSPHDRYYFTRPEEMIDGRIRVPAFSMANEPLIRKHVHSAILTLLRQLPADERRDALTAAFPRHIWPYFMKPGPGGEASHVYRDSAPTFPALRALVDANANDLRHQLMQTFTATWPDSDRRSVASDILAAMVEGMPRCLERHVEVLFRQVNSYRDRVKRFAQMQLDGRQLTSEQARDRRRYEHALDVLAREDRDRYTLTWLSNDGYLPGYALTRDSCVARCLQPYIELQRPEPIALREFTPANWIYAAGGEFAVTRVEFFSLGTSSGAAAPDVDRREMLYDAEHERVIDLSTDELVGRRGDEFSSYRMGGVELRQRQHIDDSRERRVYGAHDIVGTFLGTHHGGEAGSLGQIEWRLYRNADLRLVNLGPTGREREGLSIGFPLCTVCGAVRSPHAPAEVARFEQQHAESCGKDAVQCAALHVDFRSDLLELGPLGERADAVNLMEAALAGAREFLDMGESDLEGFVEERDDGQAWVLIYDPMPGGSGFLHQVRERWQGVCSEAQRVMVTCDCERACYACLLTFWNQRHHGVLSRHRATELVKLHDQPMAFGSSIPPNPAKAPASDVEEDSAAEQDFLDLLVDRNFPLPPEKQYTVQLSGGSLTLADFAWPEERILVYIDGMTWHGPPDVQRADRITRIKLRNAGYKVVEMTAQELGDTTAINRVLEELAVYLGKG